MAGLEPIEICACLLFFNHTFVTQNYDCYLLQTSNNTIQTEWLYCNATFHAPDLFTTTTTESSESANVEDSSDGFFSQNLTWIILGGCILVCCCIIPIARLCYHKGKKSNEIIASVAAEGHTGSSLEMIGATSPMIEEADITSMGSPGTPDGPGFSEGEIVSRQMTPQEPIMGGEDSFMYSSQEFYKSKQEIMPAEGAQTTTSLAPKRNIIPRASIDIEIDETDQSFTPKSGETGSSKRSVPGKLDIHAAKRKSRPQGLLSPDSDDAAQGLYKSLESIQAEEGPGNTRSTQDRGGEYTPSTRL